MTERDGTEGEVIYDFRDVTPSGAIINIFACYADPGGIPRWRPLSSALWVS
jgi:hypothetical protein